MKNRNSGSALIIVMCVMLVVTAISLALLRAALMVTQIPVRENQREQCRMNAVSLSELVTEEIKSFQYDDELWDDGELRDDGELWDDGELRDDGELWDDGELQDDSELWDDSGLSGKEKHGEKTSENLKEWLEMAAAGEWEAEARTCFQLQTDRLPGETWLEFYITKEESETVLYMEVSSAVGEESCKVVNRFVPAAYEDEEFPEETGWRWKFLERFWEKGES